MYIPKQFSSDDISNAKEFINSNGFGILVNNVGNRPYAAHIPLILGTGENGKDVLIGHVSRANKQWTNFDNNDVLAIFSGAHAYVSSSWYDHENVPTWNYQAIHVYGKIRIIEGDYLRNQLDKLINKYETGLSNPISMDKMTQNFLDKEIKGIVGFEIEITEYQIANKMSQNRDSNNQNKIIEGLIKKGDSQSIEVAEIIKKNKK